MVRSAARTALENMDVPEAKSVLKVTKVQPSQLVVCLCVCLFVVCYAQGHQVQPSQKKTWLIDTRVSSIVVYLLFVCLVLGSGG